MLAALVVVSGAPAAAVAARSDDSAVDVEVADDVSSDDDPGGGALKAGQVVTVAGIGEAGYSGDGWNARDARLGERLNIDVGPDGTLYIADRHNRRVRTVGGDGVIDTIGGTFAERSPDRDHRVHIDGWVYSPRTNVPEAVAVGADGVVYVAGRETIYRISPDGDREVIGGGGAERFCAGGDGGDGGPATEAFIFAPNDIAVDADGNVYIADKHNYAVRRIDVDGVITTMAGGGDIGCDEDHVDAAAHPELGRPDKVVVDSRGNVYFTEVDLDGGLSRVVRKVTPGGELSTVLGEQPEGFGGDGGPAAEAQHSGDLGGLAVDDEDNLYVADQRYGQIRMVDSDGVISTVAAGINVRNDIAIGPDGHLYLAGGARISKLALGAVSTGPDEPATPAEPAADPWADEEPGTVLTVAGTGEEPADGAADDGEPDPPRTMAAAPDGTLYYAGQRRHVVYGVNPDGSVGVVAGTAAGIGGFSGDGGPAVAAELTSPSGVAVGPDGTLYIADAGNGRVRAVDSDGIVTTVAGSSVPGEEDVDDEVPDDEVPDDEVPDDEVPDDEVPDDESSADQAEDAPGDGGAAVDAVLARPIDVAVDSAGRLYIADSSSGGIFTSSRTRIRMVDTDGTIHTVAGGGSLAGRDADDEPAVDAALPAVRSLVVDDEGQVYFVDVETASVRMVTADGILTTIVGDSYRWINEGGFAGDGGPADEAEVNEPHALALGPDGELYVADTFNNRIRKVDSDGVITTVSGTGERADSGDGGPAVDAAMIEPGALAVDEAGNLYVAGHRSERIRTIDPDGVITTVAEVVDAATSDEDAGLAVETTLLNPQVLAVEPAGVLHLAAARGPGTPEERWEVDPGGTIQAQGSGRSVVPEADGSVLVADSSRIRRVYPEGPEVIVAGAGPDSGPFDDGQRALFASLSVPWVTRGLDGAVYVADGAHDVLYRLEPDGTFSTIADAQLTARQYSGAAVDADGRVYLANTAVHRVDLIEPDGTVTAIAGVGRSSYEPDDGIGDGGPATEAVVASPQGVALGADGTVYVTTGYGIHRIDADGTIHTVLDDIRLARALAAADDDADGNDVEESLLADGAASMALDAHGNLYFAEPGRHRVRVLVRPGDIVTGSGATPMVLAVGTAAAMVVLVAVGVFGLRRRRAGRTPGRGGGAGI
ncbi:SMP-30/gluconolactonase/LRE family protein [Phytoactinopolyspora limicola]|uniref:NHL domain-containing protein n=1 Tax=Phytoactinopolyspora limicola TaxID=2715536 RepID=UPI00140818A7|nr:SMP-30/gluconolactonase/LRE family protein [Phytoactinopolyspora limicola]